tara:strand:- start:792 stop:1220 length:429 start_codon:yes stop_codon:yes gene_type:complete
MTLVKWIPRNSLINDFDNMLDTMFNDGWNRSLIKNNNLSVDIIEKENEFELTADLPGFDKKEINLSIQDKVLSLIANHKSSSDSKESYRLRERNSKSFNRSFTLPENVIEEKINAKFKNGSLKIILPKVEKIEPEIKKIKIS